MQRFETGETASRPINSHAVYSNQRARRWLLIVLGGLLAPAGALRAQSAATTSAAKNPAAAIKNSTPLGRFVPKENLVVYVEFAGLDAHAEAWKGTAAYKLLNDTLLGGMLTEVSGQLLDKALTLFPSNKTTGAEMVTLLKHAAQAGWVFAINVDPKGSAGNRGHLCCEGAASKELAPLSSRLMGTLMGEAAPRVEQKDGRTFVFVPGKGAAGSADTTLPGWVWWAERNDLVIGFLSDASEGAIAAALDGKAPCAADLPAVEELGKPDGKFQPVCVAFAETAKCPENPARYATVLRSLKSDWGIDRIDLRWGFEGNALVSVTRLAAPQPRKPALAMFDERGFAKTALLPVPEGVDSFIELSTNFSSLFETLKTLAPSGAFREQIDEISAAVHKAGSIDLQKDLLAHLGPKMAIYLAPGRSAATNDDSLETELKKGWGATAAVASLQSVFPKLTVVAEVKDPVAFGKALDAAMIAINGEFKAQAIELAAEARKEEEKKDAGNPGAGGRGGPGGDRTKRRRSPADTPAPRFQLTPAPGESKSFVLTTPSASPLKFGTAFRPTVQLEGRFFVFSISPEAAKAALAAARKKDWKLSPDMEAASEGVAASLSLLGINKVSDTLGSLLASFPGTLQAKINTAIVLLKNGGTADKSSTGPGATASAGGGPGGNSSSSGGRRFGPMGPGGSGPGSSSSGGSRSGSLGPGGGFGGSRPGGSSPPAMGAGGSSAADSAGDGTVVLKVESDKLPKTGDLKPSLFNSTLSVSASDQEIRIVSRGAFPNLSLLVDLAPIAAAMPAVQARLGIAKPPAADASQAPAAGAQPGGGEPPAAAPGGRPPSRPGGAAGKRGGRGGRDI